MPRREALEDGGKFAFVGLSMYYFENIFRSSTRVEKKLISARAASIRSRRTSLKSPGPVVLEHAHGFGAAAGTSNRAEEGYIWVLRKQ
jgi:hypothetical protein